MALDESIKQIGHYASIAWERTRSGLVWSRNVLTLNILEGVLIREKCLCAAFEKGRISAAYGTRYLTKPGIKGFREYNFRSGAYPTPEECADSIRRALNDFGARDAQIIISVPRSWIIVKHIEFPAVVKDNLASVISYELDRLTPFSPSEAMYDFSIVSEENDKIEVLLVAMRSQTLRPYLNSLDEAGLVVQRVTTGLTGFGAVCGILGNDERPALCVSVGQEDYEGCLVKNGVIISTASGYFASENQDQKMADLKEGLVPLVRKYEDEGVPPVIFLAAPPQYNLESELGVPVKPVTRDDLRKSFGVEIDDRLTGPLGGLVEALWPGQTGFNLASRGREIGYKSPINRITWVLLGLILLAMILYLVIPLHLEKARLDRIDYQISIRKNDVRAIEALKQEAAAIGTDMAVIRNFKESAPMTLDIMRELTTLLPKNVWLTRLRITGETVEIEGYAASATDLLPKIEQSPLFRKVEFSSPTIRDTRLNADRFVIKMEIEGFEKKSAGETTNARKK